MYDHGKDYFSPDRSEEVIWENEPGRIPGLLEANADKTVVDAIAHEIIQRKYRETLEAVSVELQRVNQFVQPDHDITCFTVPGSEERVVVAKNIPELPEGAIAVLHNKKVDDDPDYGEIVLTGAWVFYSDMLVCQSGLTQPDGDDTEVPKVPFDTALLETSDAGLSLIMSAPNLDARPFGIRIEYEQVALYGANEQQVDALADLREALHICQSATLDEAVTTYADYEA